MTDIALQFKIDHGRFDIAVGNDGDLVGDDGLDTAVYLSLYIDRRAEPDDVIPDGTDNRRGHCLDQFNAVRGDKKGSRLWLLKNAKETTQTLRDAEFYAAEALQWMLDDGAAQAVDVTAEHIRARVLGLHVVIIEPDGGRYEALWEYQLEAA